MSEENTKKLYAEATTPLPFEEFVKQQFAMLLKQQAEIREEALERFLQLSRQYREIETRLAVIEARLTAIEELYKDLDYKVDIFIKEQVNLKRELNKLKEAAI